MQLIVYLLSQTMGNAFDCRQIVYGCIGNTPDASESRQKPLSSFGADAFYFLKTRRLSFLVPFRAHAGNGKTVRFVADLGNQH